MKNKIIESLMDPSAYDVPVNSVKLIQTHISFVFLTGKFVYKIKKPVNFGFLDFTTLEKRKFFCNEEIRVNKRLCPDMYLDVLPITKSGGKIHVGGDGNVVEYAVKMKEIPQDMMMNRLIGAGEIDMDVMNKIAEILSEFHSNAATGNGVDTHGSIDTIKFNWTENFEQTADSRGLTIEPGIYDEIKNRIREFIRDNKNLLAKRISGERIRECHGDVHSGNIFITGKIADKTSKIYIFDAIEFNKRFSCSDVASEVAFLAMDLDFLKRRDLSGHFVRKYVKHSNDSELLRLLDFYKCYRAYVRGKVTGFKLNDPNISEIEKTEATEICRRYFDLALEYARNL